MKTLLTFILLTGVCFGQMKAPLCEGVDCIAPKCEDAEGLLIIDGNHRPNDYTGVIKNCYDDDEVDDITIVEGGYVKRITTYVNGKIVKSLSYNRSGKLYKKRNFNVNGYKEGEHVEYSRGRVELKSNYVNGKLHGKQVNYSSSNWGAGGIEGIAYFINGKRSGEWSQFRKSGDLYRKDIYDDNGRVVKEIRYNDNGTWKKTITYKNGVKLNCEGDCN